MSFLLLFGKRDRVDSGDGEGSPFVSNISFDAFSNPTPGTGDLSWTHTPNGSNVPKGVLVFIIQNAGTPDEIVGVNYGSAAMIEISGSPLINLGSEVGLVYCFFLGSGIPTGAQTVTVDVNAGATKAAGCITITAASDTELQDVDISMNSESILVPSVTLGLGGKNCFCAIGFFSGRNDVGDVTPFENWTSRYEADFVSQLAGIYTYNIIGTSDVAAGWTQNLEDDAAMIAIAIKETLA